MFKILRKGNKQTMKEGNGIRMKEGGKSKVPKVGEKKGRKRRTRREGRGGRRGRVRGGRDMMREGESKEDNLLNMMCANFLWIYFLAEAKVREDHMPVPVQQDILQLNVTIDYPQLHPQRDTLLHSHIRLYKYIHNTARGNSPELCPYIHTNTCAHIHTHTVQVFQSQCDLCSVESGLVLHEGSHLMEVSEQLSSTHIVCINRER